MEPNIKVADENYISHPLNAAKEATQRLVRTNIKPLVKLIAVTLLVTLGMVATIGGLAYFNFLSSPNSPDPASTALVSILFLVLIVVFLYLMLALGIASNYVFARSQNMEIASARHALRVGQKKVFTYIGVSIVMFFMVVGGLILLIIPGIYILLRLSYVYPIIANEESGPIQAIKRSFALTKGNLWDIVGIGAIALILNMFVEIPNLIAESFLYESVLYIPVITLYILLAIVIGVVTTTFIFFRYHQSDLEKKSVLTKTYTSRSNYLYLLIAVVVAIAFSAISGAAALDQMHTSPNEYVELNEQIKNDLQFN